jgi:hypothetical protein
LVLGKTVLYESVFGGLRAKVLDAVDYGMPRKEVTRIFGFSLPLDQMLATQKGRKETVQVGAKVPAGPPAIKGAMLKEWLPGHLRRNPNLTLEEHCEAFEEELGVRLSTATESRHISHFPGGGRPIKKSLR